MQNYFSILFSTLILLTSFSASGKINCLERDTNSDGFKDFIDCYENGQLINRKMDRNRDKKFDYEMVRSKKDVTVSKDENYGGMWNSCR